MKVRECFPGIAKAALEISYDNGGINRERSEASMLRALGRFLERQPHSRNELQAIDKWLSSLSDSDLNTVCAGEITDVLALINSAPPWTDSLLNDIFEQVG